MFRFFDSDGNGVISPGELENGLVCLAKVYGIEFSSGQVKELCKHLDKNKDNSIDYEEFFSCFSVANPKLAKYLKDTPAYQRLRGGEINKAPVPRGLRPARQLSDGTALRVTEALADEKRPQDSRKIRSGSQLAI